MRLAELSAGYREAAGLLDIQISRLRRLRRGTADAQTRAVLANRLRKLCEARRQCRELALLCEHYYEGIRSLCIRFFPRPRSVSRIRSA